MAYAYACIDTIIYGFTHMRMHRMHMHTYIYISYANLPSVSLSLSKPFLAHESASDGMSVWLILAQVHLFDSMKCTIILRLASKRNTFGAGFQIVRGGMGDGCD